MLPLCSTVTILTTKFYFSSELRLYYRFKLKWFSWENTIHLFNIYTDIKILKPAECLFDLTEELNLWDKSRQLTTTVSPHKTPNVGIELGAQRIAAGKHRFPIPTKE